MKLTDLLEDRGRVVNRHRVPILMSTDAAQRCVRAEDAVTKARQQLEAAEIFEDGRLATPRTKAARAKLTTAEAELAAANEAAAEHLVDFVVESVGSDVWEELVLAHQPTDEQREKDPDAEYDPRTFPIFAVAACLSEPEVGSVDDVRKLKRAIPDAAWQQIFVAVLRVNRGANRVPLSLSGSDATRPSEAKSEPQ